MYRTVAMKLAARDSHRVKSLALLSTHSGGFFRRSPTVAGLNLIARMPFAGTDEFRTHLDLLCHFSRRFLLVRTAEAQARGRAVLERRTLGFAAPGTGDSLIES